MKRFLSLLLICALTTCSCAAASPSTWANDSVIEATGLGFVPEDLLENYQDSISRVDFARLAVNFVAFQYGYRYIEGSFREGIVMQFFEDHCQNHVAPDGSRYQLEDYFPGVAKEDIPESWAHMFNGPVEYHPFSDFPPYQEGKEYTEEEIRALNDDPMYAGIAQIIGIINGRTETTFDPYGEITRQEAAVMLARTYCVYSGTRPENTDMSPYSDQAEIADWARDAIAMVTALGVMNGVQPETFDPNGKYTVEQSITTLVRLYEKAPISAKNNNVPPLRSYEDTWKSIVDNMHAFSLEVQYEQETPTYKVVCGNAAIGMMGWENPYFAYVLLPAGGWYRLNDLPWVTVQEFSLDQENDLLTVSGTSGNELQTYTIDILTGKIVPN